MEEYQGLLVSITTGTGIPHRTVCLAIIYGNHVANLSPVDGKEVTAFNQGYIFRNLKANGHDESDQPLTIQLFEKRSLLKNVLIAQIQMESFNFYKWDYYESENLKLQSARGYNEYEIKLNTMIEFITPNSKLLLSESALRLSTLPIAYQVSIVRANLEDNKKDRFYSCTLDISNSVFIRTRGIQGAQPEWNQRQFISIDELSDPAHILFHIDEYADPHGKGSTSIYGTCSVNTKGIRMDKTEFSLPIMNRKRELGSLQVQIVPIYAESRDTIAREESINRKDPNEKNITLLGSPIYSTYGSRDDPLQPCVSVEKGDSPDCQEYYRNGVWHVKKSIRDCIMGSNCYMDRGKQNDPPFVSQIWEAKKPEERELKRKDIRVSSERKGKSTIRKSQCTSIIRDKDQNGRMRLSPVFNSSYFENISFEE